MVGVPADGGHEGLTTWVSIPRTAENKEMKQSTHGLYDLQRVVEVLAYGRCEGLTEWVCIPSAAGSKFMNPGDGPMHSQLVQLEKGIQCGRSSCQQWT